MTDHSKLDNQIQLLVDDELSAIKQTAVLQHCEQQPEAWRQLALGLLEAREIKAGLSELVTLSRVAPVLKVRDKKKSQSSRWVWNSAVACFAVATFFAGLGVRQWLEASSSALDTPVRSFASGNTTPDEGALYLSEDPTAVSPKVKTTVTDVTPAANVAAVENTLAENALADLTAAKNTVAKNTAANHAADEARLSVVGYARILHQDGSEPPVPVITGPDLNYSSLLTQQRRIPTAMARQYRNEGLVVESQRRVMSLTLVNGQQFAIPLDQLGVRYVGNDLL